jgi:hypothetical protein
MENLKTRRGFAGLKDLKRIETQFHQLNLFYFFERYPNFSGLRNTHHIS